MMSCNKNSSDSISPGPNRSLPFSISAILSDEVGQKKSPPATCSGTPFSVESIKGSACTSNHYASETPKRPRKSSHSFSSSRTPKMSHSDTGKAQPNYQVVGGTSKLFRVVCTNIHSKRNFQMFIVLQCSLWQHREIYSFLKR